MSSSSLIEIHERRGAQMVQVNGISVPAKYSSVEEEYAVTRKYAAFFDLSHFGKLRLTGKDALDLVNRISTNDLDGMRPGMGKQSFFATEKGRVVDLCTVYMQQVSILIRTSPNNSGNVKKWIEKFVISEDVKVEDVTESFPMFYVAGPSSADFLNKFAHSSFKSFLDISEMPRFNFIRTFLGPHEIFLSRVNFVMGDGYILYVNPADSEAIWNSLLDNSEKYGAVPAGSETFEVLRIENGTPLYPQELNEDMNPLEVNAIEAISDNKGCYVGQEVIARLQTYDKVRKRLVGLVADSKMPHGSKVYDGRSGTDNEIGVVTSSVKSPGLGKEIALAYISMQQVIPGSKYSVRVGAKTFDAELSTLPFTV